MTDIVLHTIPHDDHVHVTLVGALEDADARAARDQLRRLIDPVTPARLVIDLTGCTGIDTHGILALTTKP
jgi:anti-anti-sigma regulatory factor